jgi:leucyl aminopeptidase
MLHPLLAAADDGASIPVHCLPASAEASLSILSEPARRYLAATGFKLGPGKLAIAPGADGAIEAVILGIDEADSGNPDRLVFGKLMTGLPEGVYALQTLGADPELAAISLLMSSYRFMRYKANAAAQPRFILPTTVDAVRVSAIAEGMAFGRDLINTPANDLPPEALGQAALDLAVRIGAKASIISGDALLDANFPMVHAVGRAAGNGSVAQQPRLVDIRIGPDDAKRVTLVGKGVCFDTGGLNIKPESAMLLMKKDMGGAAIALSILHMVAALHVPVQLRVILPIVENSIAGNAFRPGDVLQTRKGITVEIGNTDAEGRLILGDALALAAEEPVDALIDFATLTGAARVALGPDLPATFYSDDALAMALEGSGRAVQDLSWRLPLHASYASLLDSPIADINHIGSGGFAGSILAALFLQRFVPKGVPWAHIDTFAWRPSALPGRPQGGEPQMARAVLHWLEGLAVS